MKSEEFYDHLSDDYAHLSGVNASYVESVDRVVADYVAGVQSWLDVGTGDGSRAEEILRSVTPRPARITLCDNSPGMVSTAASRVNVDEVLLWGMESSHPFGQEEKFDAITLLGNVLGHVMTHRLRAQYLCNVSKLLSKDGALILDFNNRWNARQYGCVNVIKNMGKSAIGRHRTKFTAMKRVNGKDIQTPVYLGSPLEYRRILAEAGLNIEAIVYRDYRTGREASAFTGQGVVVARTKEDQ